MIIFLVKASYQRAQGNQFQQLSSLQYHTASNPSEHLRTSAKWTIKSTGFQILSQCPSTIFLVVSCCFSWMTPNLYLENGWKSPKIHFKLVVWGSRIESENKSLEMDIMFIYFHIPCWISEEYLEEVGLVGSWNILTRSCKNMRKKHKFHKLPFHRYDINLDFSVRGMFAQTGEKLFSGTPTFPFSCFV